MKTDFPSSTKARSILLVVGTAVLAFVVMLVFLYSIDSSPSSTRQAGVTVRGSEAAPFDPERTVSLFQMLADGGLYEVIVRDSLDRRQVAVIQTHLRDKAEKYGSGDFSDAAQVHSEEMSWLEALKVGASQVKVSYTDVPNGGQIRFTTANPTLVRTLHQWLMAQVSDWERQASGR